MRDRLPRLPAWIVRRTVGPALADDVLGDLEERWRRDASRSRVGAWMRALRVALSVAWHAWRDRRDRARPRRRIGAALILQDARYALRLLRRQPVTSGAVVLTLALAIGASTALFSVVNAWVLRPLPFATPDRLAAVWETIPSAGIDQNTPAPAVFHAWRDRLTSFDAMAALTRGTRNLTGQGEPARLSEIRAQPSVLAMLGIRPVVGRIFRDDEGRAPAAPVVLLSQACWRQRFGGAPDVVGRIITLDGAGYEVVGVLPANARPFGFDPDVWTPLAFTPEEAQSFSRYLWVLGRLKPGVTVETASAEVNQITASASENAIGARAVSLRTQTLGDTRADVLVLFGASGFVLLVACANIASLTLAQVVTRRRELAARQALGASRGRLVRQVLIESLTVGTIAGALGFLLSGWATRAVVSLAPAAARLGDVNAFDPRVFGFACAAGIGTALLFGLLPAWQSGRIDPAGGLRAGGRSSTAGRRRLLGAIVAAEIAMTLVLLVATALITRSFLRMNAMDLGFDPDGLVLADLPRPGSLDPVAFYGEVERRLRETPGVRGVALSQGLPLATVGAMGGGFSIEGQPADARVLAYWRSANADFFRTLGVTIMQGRAITADDRAGGSPVAVVSESFARRAWPDGGALGRRIGWGTAETPITVVGVAADVRQSRATEPSPTVYLPYPQVDGWSPSQIAVRSDLGTAATGDLLRRVVHDVDPAQPVEHVRSASDQLWELLGRRRFHLTLFGLLAAMATALAIFGLYALLASALSAERRDLGIRAALGATPAQLRREWWGRGLRLSAFGLALGGLAAWWSGGLLDGFLFKVEPRDPVAFAAAAALVLATTMAACWAPARRAGRADPVETLREGP